MALTKMLGPAMSDTFDAAGMAWLGPPSAAYPPDPEAYAFYRTGGGYAAVQVSGSLEGCTLFLFVFVLRRDLQQYTHTFIA